MTLKINDNNFLNFQLSLLLLLLLLLFLAVVVVVVVVLVVVCINVPLSYIKIQWDRLTLWLCAKIK